MPFCDAHLLSIRLCLTQLKNLSWLLLLREREHLGTFFRTPFCASAQWQKNLLSIKVINCLIGGVSNPHCKICLCQIHKTLIFFVCCCKPPVVSSCSLTSPCYQAEVCPSRDGVCLPCVLSLPQQSSSASEEGTPHPLGAEPLGVPGGSCNVEDFMKCTVMNLPSGILFLNP